MIDNHLDKIFFPENGITKGDLVDYYEKIADILLPYLKDRPQNLHRFPKGIEGISFYQKDNEHLPDFAQTVKIHREEDNKIIHYLLCQNKETLLYMIHLGCIEINPWNSRVEKLDYPDYLVLDLDPEDIDFKAVVKTAQVIKGILDERKMKSYCKTSGAAGLHIIVPTDGKHHYETVKDLAESIATKAHQLLPEITSLERHPDKRKKKVYLDFLQNSKGQTIASVYTVRPRPGAPVSTPLKWEEVNDKLDPQKFTIKTIFQRIEKVGDFWKETKLG